MEVHLLLFVLLVSSPSTFLLTRSDRADFPQGCPNQELRSCLATVTDRVEVLLDQALGQQLTALQALQQQVEQLGQRLGQQLGEQLRQRLEQQLLANLTQLLEQQGQQQHDQLQSRLVQQLVQSQTAVTVQIQESQQQQLQQLQQTQNQLVQQVQQSQSNVVGQLVANQDNVTLQLQAEGRQRNQQHQHVVQQLREYFTRQQPRAEPLCCPQNETARLLAIIQQQQTQILTAVTTRTSLRADCSELIGVTSESGVYPLTLSSLPTFDVYCDMQTPGSGWLVIQRRTNAAENFFRNWADYKAGFGRVDRDFWIGNDRLHQLTASGRFKLRVDVEYRTGAKKYAEYSSFAVASESQKYRLSIYGYSGNMPVNALSQANNYYFSTFDRDNDPIGSSNLAQNFGGGWWYCAASRLANLNGPYVGSGARILHWYYYDAANLIQSMTIKIKPR